MWRSASIPTAVCGSRTSRMKRKPHVLGSWRGVSATSHSSSRHPSVRRSAQSIVVRPRKSPSTGMPLIRSRPSHPCNRRRHGRSIVAAPSKPTEGGGTGMKRFTNEICSLLCAAILTSCSTSSDSTNQILGGLGGAALGAGIGALATHGDTTAILAGAAAGAVAGWATVKLVQYHSEQTRSASEEAKALGYRSTDGMVVKIRGATVSPSSARAGDNLNLSMNYAVLAPEGTSSVPVSETWTLEKDGEKLASVPPKQESRAPGGWQTQAGINVPKNAGKGTYVVKNRVEAGNSYDERVSTFTIH